ncbi:MAG: HAD hydrolase-like protein [Verrucomicrobiaceae bacterium]|nr:HAD hydrolase-like protein [Verrucomicrobiaceae bacterium]
MSNRRRIIFDMDGVITSEEGYWRAAACALMEFAEVEAPADPWSLELDRVAIGLAKQRLINTNWDLCHIAALALLIGDELPEKVELGALVKIALAAAPEHSGYELIEKLAEMAGGERFQRNGPLWTWLFDRFQEWFNGLAGRRGIIEDEPLILPPEKIKQTLEALKKQDWELGVATGRTSAELLPTLERHGMLGLFDHKALVTHDQVAQAEKELGGGHHLSKPHPFPFLRSLFPDKGVHELTVAPWPKAEGEVIIVGDTAGDMRGAHALGVRAVAVLTGPAGAAGEAALRAAGATDVVQDITQLPALL